MAYIPLSLWKSCFCLPNLGCIPNIAPCDHRPQASLPQEAERVVL